MNDVTQDTPVKAKKAPTEYIKVTMEDGRTVDFAASRKTDKTILEDAEGNAIGVRIDFVNGATRSVLFSELSQGILLQSCGHGISQKAGDNYASVKEVEDMVLAVDEIFGRLRQGDWAVKGEPGDSTNGASIVIKAIMEVTSKDITFVKGFLQGKLDAAKARGEKLSRQELYNSFRVPTSKTGQVIKRMEEEKLSKSTKADAGALLEEMGAA